MSRDPLGLFLPAVRDWFRATLGEPTAAQTEGWPRIAAGQNTLILAPTGSGKTLAAFLACLDQLWREPPRTAGVRVLYISPLKALNNDIHRNLQVPLDGITALARLRESPLPMLETAVRTGDTPARDRQRLIRQPPHILITTPESLHLLLTSRARETLRGVTHCIVDEIHALSANKRGVFLSLLLERLEALCEGRRGDRPGSFVRIGLSATQRPLEEVARYLGGMVMDGTGQVSPRPVSIVDAGLRKDLDLRVVSPEDSFGPFPEHSVWPSIYRRLGEEIRQHRSTIIFANNRRAVERITSALNEEEEIARAHHGSVALEVRQDIETALKEGRLPAVVATASLEMGIDMGAVDLVCQVESPGSVARALQRVGRAGHLVGERSKGRLYPKSAGDLLEQAVLARAMMEGQVEAIQVPQGCLDVLAQQLVALAAVDDWKVPELFALVRRAYPYRDLSAQAFEATLEMISGRFRAANGPGTLEALQPRVSWDRAHNVVRALPGSQRLALVNGGTIPDTGQYAVYNGPGVRIGELDEEFIYERRVGDIFLLGTSAWRVERIEADRVLVRPAEGVPAIVPFWRGENSGRSHDLGRAIGAFLRELGPKLGHEGHLDWLQQEYFLDTAAARSLARHVERQLRVAGSLPTDRTLVIEASRDPLGDWQVILLSPLGSRLHLSLRLAVAALLKERLGYHPQCLHHDDGLLVRQTDTDEPILDLLEGLTPENVEELILNELVDSALFALRFRQNASRALLLPRAQPGRRAPLWLQRLRGRDLLQVARQQPDFPIVIETFRECLHDHLDVPRLRRLLEEIRGGQVEIVTRRAAAPSPFAAGLLFAFTAANMYQYDAVEGKDRRELVLDRQLLEQMIAPERQMHLLDPRAVHQVERRLRGVGQPPRSVTEMGEWLRRLGDLAGDELEGPMAGFLEQLVQEERAVRIELPGVRQSMRWVSSEDVDRYRQAFGLEGASREQAQEAGAAILSRFLSTHALVGLEDVLGRYPFDTAWARRQLEEWARSGRIVAVPGPSQPLQWSAPANLEQVQRGTLALLRREVVTCSPPQLADFMLRWQGVHPEAQRGSSEGLAEVLECLQGMPLEPELWEQAVLPARVPGYQGRWLDEWIGGGTGVWACRGSLEAGLGQLAFFARETVRHLAVPGPAHEQAPEGATAAVVDCLRSGGAAFVSDLAAETGVSPSEIRRILAEVVCRGLATNDRFDVIRRGDLTTGQGQPDIPSGGEARVTMRRMANLGRPRQGLNRPEGRWSLLRWGRPEPEGLAVAQVEMLLRRYGVLTRELVLLDPWALPWRVLYEVLSWMELTGQVRRGYFVEGLAGAQFALPEAVERLQMQHRPATGPDPVVLLHSQDPANLYGAGAPFDLPLLSGGTRPLLRRGGNWLVLQAGRPVLLIEQHGRRLTALPSASAEVVRAAVACLPRLCSGSQSASIRHKITVEEWNGEPVTQSEGIGMLEAAGFVRDYQGMTLYAAWQ